MQQAFRPIMTNPQVASFTGVRTLVVGLGRFGGGVGVTQWLAGQGAIVTVTDQADAGSLAESLREIADLPITFCLGGHDACDLSQTDLVIINPAVHKSRSALFGEILRREIPWTTEINLFCERCPAPVVGVTGSFGKSTTSAMLAHVLEGCRQGIGAKFTGVHLGGNIGRSLLGDLPDIRPTDLVVLEMSNAQLEDINRMDWGPAVAVITNLFPHHLDRYDNFEGYAQAKLNLVRAGGKTCAVIAGEMDPLAERLLEEAVGRDASRLTPVAKPKQPIELLVPGEHNQVNAACVMTVCRVMGLNAKSVRESLRTFRGLPHRLELVGEFGGVEYINDSKSTAPAATIIAVDALRDRQGRLIAIVGGQRKDVSLVDCARALAQSCRMVICYGEAGSAFAAAVSNAETPIRQNQYRDREEAVSNTETPIRPNQYRDREGAVSNTETPIRPNQYRDREGAVSNTETKVFLVQKVDDAVVAAANVARPGETVLFSPGAPSFDQYANFTERGKHFAALVSTLK